MLLLYCKRESRALISIAQNLTGRLAIANVSLNNDRHIEVLKLGNGPAVKSANACATPQYLYGRTSKEWKTKGSDSADQSKGGHVVNERRDGALFALLLSPVNE